MAKFVAINAFKRQRQFLRTLADGKEVPDQITKDQSRALISFLHCIVRGHIPIKADTFRALCNTVDLSQLQEDIEKTKKYKSLLKASESEKREFLNKFKGLWKPLLVVLFH